MLVMKNKPSIMLDGMSIKWLGMHLDGVKRCL